MKNFVKTLFILTGFTTGCAPTYFSSDIQNIKIGSSINLPHEKLILTKISNKHVVMKSNRRTLILKKDNNLGENMGEGIRLKLIGADIESATISVVKSSSGFMFP
jgi:hypothetical protein